MALSRAVNRHPSKPEDDSRVSTSLRSAIQKSGMVLLDDFGDIVHKAADLWRRRRCVRLASLVNLGNSKDWNALVKLSANAVDGVNVLLRPVSARVAGKSGHDLQRRVYFLAGPRAAQSLDSPLGGSDRQR